ncbi:craniofacial development protein 1 isoform X2 [Alligator mississippiensis]|uniref:craniofacial development protein 1 isoform X2 n=1 Tax=Alligator mississippiensis TaxID=8496 RepID=UPI0028775460|nr:craniofacial development protein 1 isoform X2 [Alligator mississippiensis]
MRLQSAVSAAHVGHAPAEQALPEGGGGASPGGGAGEGHVGAELHARSPHPSLQLRYWKSASRLRMSRLLLPDLLVHPFLYGSAALERSLGSAQFSSGGEGCVSSGSRVSVVPARSGMSGSEDYSSAEDEDYVPSGAEYSEDDVSELVEEDEEENLNKRKKGSKSIACRKRKKGGLLLEPGDSEEAKAQQGEKEEVDSLRQVEGDRSEEEEKKKEDALWASFLSDVGQKPKTLAAAQVTSPQTCKTVKKNLNKSLKEVEEPEEQKDIEKVTITKVFDFAGEEVRVTKEVDAASKEAKSFLEQQEKEKTQTAIPASLPTVSGVKRPSGMNSLLGKIGSKKQKMNTLEKSRLDWENFKDEQGIGEELAIHNRGKEGNARPHHWSMPGLRGVIVMQLLPQYA